VLVIALGAAVASAVWFQGAPVASPQPAAARGVDPEVSPPTPEPAANADDPEKAGISGKVLERLDVPKYTYLRLATAAGETWAAVSSANVKVGDAVRVINAQLMTEFASATLKRKFARIYFGALAEGSKAAAPDVDLSQFLEPEYEGDPHAGVPGAPPIPAGAVADEGANPHGTAAGANPHSGTAVASDTVVVGHVVKAEGKNGRTVAELFAQRRTLKDHSVRVRGVVVKLISAVLDRSFVHLRDGSENAEVKDLVVTTHATPAVGDHVLFEGKVTTDKDFGAGYVYPVLLEDAALLDQ
jgi:hypothetical protein